MWPSVGWVWVLFPWLKQWMCFRQVLCQLHPPPNSCRTCLIARRQRGRGRKATGIVWHRSLQNSLPYSHHVLNVLRVTDFISELYEPSDRKYTVDTKLFFLFVCCGCSAVCPCLWKLQIFQKKKKSAQCALQLYKLHSASTDVDMLQSEWDRFLKKKRISSTATTSISMVLLLTVHTKPDKGFLPCKTLSPLEKDLLYFVLLQGKKELFYNTTSLKN